MAQYISEEKISEIINASDIIEVISDVVLLKKAGREHMGLCPFHAEKTPSFTVNREKQLFYCHGCHEGGNVFNFLMKHNGLSFPDSARMLAGRYGIDIPDRQMSAGQKRRANERDYFIAINREAGDFFRRSLLETDKGNKALSYLNKRGISQEVINDFRLGYAPDGWNNFVTYCLKNKKSLSLVEKTGLVIPKKESRGFYDRFRDRIIFPIIDINSRIIGFGGRVMDDSKPKYLNSPESVLYNKSRSLYGINMAKDECRKTGIVYIVEGYFDLIALYQHGIKNVVATLGTAMTLEHLQLLKGFIGKNGRVLLVYDSDEAGLKAAQRSIGIFDKGYVDARILKLPDGYDPDSYIFNFGKESFLQASSRALAVIPFLIESAEKKYGLSTEGKIKIVTELSKILASVNDNLVRAIYIKELAERTGISEMAIMERIRQARTKNHTQFNKRFKQSGDTGGPSGSDGWNRREFRIERHIISMMLQFPDILSEISKKNVLEYFEDTSLKAVGRILLQQMGGAGKKVSEVIALIDDKVEKNIIIALALKKEPWDLNARTSMITKFVDFRRNNRNNFILNSVKKAEENNNDELLLKSLIEGNRRLKNLKDSQVKLKKRGLYNI
ncbi:DNA primase [Desulfosarcina sp. BuS5]|uniref:DNA primase n=1 Tax=Desulfosarcina sp. BuS5 TaxID=933262 RepID=UPI000A871D94|nr:DNA primase [Desulfosarcina sp. BuS5]WDN90624.1 DNA primase [Desulfosarcina sp. BuS5]